MLLWFLATFVILAVGGFVYQSIATARDNRRYKRPGQMVNNGGRRLHVVVKAFRQVLEAAQTDRSLSDDLVSLSSIATQ